MLEVDVHVILLIHLSPASPGLASPGLAAPGLAAAEKAQHAHIKQLPHHMPTSSSCPTTCLLAASLFKKTVNRREAPTTVSAIARGHPCVCVSRVTSLLLLFLLLPSSIEVSELVASK